MILEEAGEAANKRLPGYVVVTWYVPASGKYVVSVANEEVVPTAPVANVGVPAPIAGALLCKFNIFHFESAIVVCLADFQCRCSCHCTQTIRGGRSANRQYLAEPRSRKRTVAVILELLGGICHSSDVGHQRLNCSL